MVFSTNLCFTMLISFIFHLERFSLAKVLAALLLVSGGVLQGVSTWKDKSDEQGHTSLTGYCVALVAMVLGASRWALTQYLLQNRSGTGNSGLANLGKFEMIARVMPLTSVICGVLAMIFESPPRESFTYEVFENALAVAVGVTILVGSEYALVQLTSAVALNVAGALHNIPVVVSGVFFFDEKVKFYSVFGFGFCVIGALVYTLDYQKSNGVDPASAEQQCTNQEAPLEVQPEVQPVQTSVYGSPADPEEETFL